MDEQHAPLATASICFPIQLATFIHFPPRSPRLLTPAPCSLRPLLSLSACALPPLAHSASHPRYTSPSDLGIFAASNQVPVQTFACPAGGCSNTACEGYDPNMKNKGHLCAEGNLDTQFISGVGQGANNTFYLNTNLDTPFLEFITYISTLAAPPGTVSISYGSYEYEMDHAIMDHFTTEAMKLGAQGVSILSASGDDGVAGYKARNDTSQCASHTPVSRPRFKHRGLCGPGYSAGTLRIECRACVSAEKPHTAVVI